MQCSEMKESLFLEGQMIFKTLRLTNFIHPDDRILRTKLYLNS